MVTTSSIDPRAQGPEGSDTFQSSCWRRLTLRRWILARQTLEPVRAPSTHFSTVDRRVRHLFNNQCAAQCRVQDYNQTEQNSLSDCVHPKQQGRSVDSCRVMGLAYVRGRLDRDWMKPKRDPPSLSQPASAMVKASYYCSMIDGRIQPSKRRTERTSLIVQEIL